MSLWDARENLRRAVIAAHQAARDAAHEPLVADVIRRCADALHACSEILRQLAGEEDDEG